MNKIKFYKIRMLYIFVITVSIVILAFCDNNTNSQDYYNDSLIYFEKGLYNDALKKITIAIESDPNRGKYYVLRGKIYQSLKLYGDAESDYLKAIEIDPDYSTPILELANLLSWKESYEQVIYWYSKLISLEPNNPDIFIKRGVSYSFIFNFYEAIDDIGSAIDLIKTRKESSERDLALAYYQRAIIQYDLGNYKFASKDYQLSKEHFVFQGTSILDDLNEGYKITTGSQFIDFELVTEKGVILNNETLRGKWYLLFIWEPSETEMIWFSEKTEKRTEWVVYDDFYTLEDLYQTYGNSLQIISVFKNKSSVWSKKYLKKEDERSWHYLIGNSNAENVIELSEFDDINKIILIDPNGIIRLINDLNDKDSIFKMVSYIIEKNTIL